MGCITWIIFGALAGWIASLILGRSKEMGCLAHIFIGILGSVLGGLMVSLLGGGGITGFNLSSFAVAVLGAIILLSITGWYSRQRGF